MKKLLLLTLLLVALNIGAANPVARSVSVGPELDDIVRAMCLVESDNRAGLRGHSGERGIMQMMRNEWEFSTHNLMGVSKRNHLLDGVDYSWDSAYNKTKAVRVGTVYMEYLIDKYGDWTTAVKVYHSGHRGVFKLNRGGSYLAMVRKAMACGNTAWRKAKRNRRG